MVEVEVYTVRVSLLNQARVVILRELHAENPRYLAIWIGSYEADAIALELEGQVPPRPQTHDLFLNVLKALGVRIARVVVNDLRENTFYGRLILDWQGKELQIDSRPSDAIALAVRAGAPIFVAEHVLQEAGLRPDREEGELSPSTPETAPEAASEPTAGEPLAPPQEEGEDEEDLSPFRRFFQELEQQGEEGEEGAAPSEEGDR